MKRAILGLSVLFTACPQDPKSETATDTEPSTGGATETTTGGATETTTGGATEVTTSGATETGATDAGGTETSGGMEWPECAAPDPALTEGFEFDTSVWAPDFDMMFGFEQALAINASCVVAAVTPQGVGTSKIDLTCTEGAQVDVSVSFVLTMPEDIPLPFAPGETVKLSYRAHSEDIDLLPGDHFAIHDEAGTRLLLAGFDDPLPVGWWSNVTAPLTVEKVGGLCPCEGACDGESGTEREALRVSDGMGHEVVVIDRQRGTLAIPGSPYEVVVRAAVNEFCLNCRGDHRALIVATP